MYKLLVDIDLNQALKGVPTKTCWQIARKIFALGTNPRPQDCKSLEGIDGYRVDSGEYRILYTVDDKEQVVTVYLIGKRGNDAVYRAARRRR